ncbi:MAG TPA: LCP family protein [Candidatus Saccharimonadales bacterium]|nr:LCP family protein [Candidatus Saccharimonadales bacterium]
MQYVDLGQLHQKPKSSKKKNFLKFGIIILFVSLILYAGYILYWPTLSLIKQIARSPKAALSLIKNPEGELKESNGRTNFLLIGIDKRSNIPYSYSTSNGDVHQNGFLTDTIIVASVNKENKKVSMISIPRDLWVVVPSSGKFKGYQGKINAVYASGEQGGYDGGGMALLSKTLEKILGIDEIHYSTRIDFDGFRQGIDSLGGIDVTVDKAFDDYEYPIEGKESANCPDKTFSCRYLHVHFNAGANHMNGQTALEFARSRHGTNGEGSDFARAARQQKVLVAAKDKALKAENLLDPIKINNLFKDFGQSVETDIDVSATVALYNLSKEVNSNAINSLVLSNAPDSYLYVPPANQYGGAYTLLPKGNSWTQIQDAVDKLFSGETPAQKDPKQ